MTGDLLHAVQATFPRKALKCPERFKPTSQTPGASVHNIFFSVGITLYEILFPYVLP